MIPRSLPLSFGVLELIATALTIVPAAILLARRNFSARYFVGAGISMAVASIVTPADLFSTVLLASVFFVMFLLGGRMSAPGMENGP